MIIDLYPSNISVWSEKKTKPILRPMSDLYDTSKSFMEQLHEEDSTIEFNSGSFYYAGASFEDPCFLPYVCFEVLLKNHFDVFGLIEQGLAIDINTLES